MYNTSKNINQKVRTLRFLPYISDPNFFITSHNQIIVIPSLVPTMCTLAKSKLVIFFSRVMW